jgi:heat shock protein HtpX
MDQSRLEEHRLLNLAQTLLLIAGMVGVLWLSARLLLGPGAAWWLAGMAAVLLLFAPRLSPALVLRLYQAEPLRPTVAPQLFAVLNELAQRAGLARVPGLYYIPSRVNNAFAVGGREDAVIGITDGMLRTLSLRELAAVLAHEITHVRHNDIRVMALADLITRMTQLLAVAGQLLLLVGLPLWLAGLWDISFVGIALLLLAPTATALLQLALSRTREYHADLGAARLTGDPRGLASALAKLERGPGGWLEQVLFPSRHNPDPSRLRTHPPTAERIRRLLELAPADGSPLPGTGIAQRLVRAHPPHTPRQRPWGVWY